MRYAWIEAHIDAYSTTLMCELLSGADLLKAGRLRREWIEFRAIPGAHSRLSYLAARAFPSSEFMHERYPQSHPRALFALHALRWREALGKMTHTRRR